MDIRLFRKKQEDEDEKEASPSQPQGHSYLIDYDDYAMDKQEKVKYTAIAAVFLFAIGYIFFESIILSLLLSGAGLLYPKLKRQDFIDKRKKELNMQFKDALYSLSSALSVGRSLESAFGVALSELRILYPDEDANIIKEFEYICRRIEMNEPVERALLGFSSRAHLEDITNFADVMVICKRTGGNLVEVVKNTSNIINDKMEIEQEIDLLLSGKKFEQKMLNYMPLVFFAMIKFGSAGYMDALYTSVKGYLLMGVAFLILAVSYFVSKKIMDIKV